MIGEIRSGSSAATFSFQLYAAKEIMLSFSRDTYV